MWFQSFFGQRSSKRGASHGTKHSHPVRPCVEVLEERLQPAVLTASPLSGLTYQVAAPTPFQTATPSYQVTLPSPLSIAGKSVHLWGSWNQDVAVLRITTIQQASNGTYTFTGTYTLTENAFGGQSGVNVLVVGTLGAPTLGGSLLATTDIHFRGSVRMADGFMRQVNYDGTFNQNWSQATTWGSLRESVENPPAIALFEGPWHNYAPIVVSVTFA